MWMYAKTHSPVAVSPMLCCLFPGLQEPQSVHPHGITWEGRGAPGNVAREK
jgi:hypothetical protein